MAGYTNVMMLDGAWAGAETTRGTTVNPTRILYPTAGGVSLTYNQSADDYTEATRSYFGKRTHALGLYSVDMSVEERVSYEDIAWWLNFALKGGVTTPTTSGTTGKLYTFTPSADTDNLKFMTMVVGDDAGANVYKVGGLAVNELQLKFDPAADATWMMSAALMGNSLEYPDVYSTVSTERSRTMVLARGTKMYVDDVPVAGTTTTTAAPLTQLQGIVRSGQITIQNNWERKAFLENAQTYHPDMGRGEQMVTGEFTFEFFNDNQFSDMREGKARSIRIESEGATIGAGPAKYKLTIDLPNAYYNAPSIRYSGQNKIITFGVVGYTSATTAYPVQVQVVNALSSLTL